MLKVGILAQLAGRKSQLLRANGTQITNDHFYLAVCLSQRCSEAHTGLGFGTFHVEFSSFVAFLRESVGERERERERERQMFKGSKSTISFAYCGSRLHR